MNKNIFPVIFLFLLLAACGSPAPPLQETPTPLATQPAQLPNPASQNCIDQGGSLTIEVRGDSGQYGVCTFEDNRQCEEWALLRGECPVGGLKVTGYATNAARYCAITGGAYAVTGNSNTDTELGTCTFPNGVVCDVWDVYKGQCSASQPPAPGSVATPTPAGGSQHIVFDSNRSQSGYRDLYVMDGSSSSMRSLTQGDGNSFAGPWSPDGKRIVYTTFGLTNSAIAAINADGSGQATLAAIDGSDEAFPDWSPDGSRIAFTSRRDGNNEIYMMNADGSNPIRITNNPADDFAPSWSPDGKRLVFVSDRDHNPGIYDLYMMSADGSGVARLTDDTAIDYSPDWSPDGKSIVFRSHHGGPADIYVINVDGTGLADLTDNPAEDWAPSWSPDGSLVVFQTDRDGNWEVYSMRADGADPVNLTHDPADDQNPYYAP
jgi:Tol biopolymer transport system component/putative hemolysin